MIKELKHSRGLIIKMKNLKPKAIMSWSGGKDSSMAFYENSKSGRFEITSLLTTVTEGYDRISMHGVRRVLLEQQAKSMGVPVEKVYISQKSSNEEYEHQMREKLLKFKQQGVSAVVIGDIFLEDLKKYREEKLAEVEMTGVFPIWKRDTVELAHKFIELGFKARITCIDSEILPKEFTGRDFDRGFLSDLPAKVDPCGENGEFHSFVYDGPIFKAPISCQRGKIVLRDERFYFCDLIPA